jgi:hypothetical protein
MDHPHRSYGPSTQILLSCSWIATLLAEALPPTFLVEGVARYLGVRIPGDGEVMKPLQLVNRNLEELREEVEQADTAAAHHSMDQLVSTMPGFRTRSTGVRRSTETVTRRASA